MVGKPSVDKLPDPEPEFVTAFIQTRMEKGIEKDIVVRDLNAFFLDMTPLPHEDAVTLIQI